jgi:hypothetical protein
MAKKPVAPPETPKTPETPAPVVSEGFKTTNAALVDDLQRKGFTVVGIVSNPKNKFILTYEFKQTAEEMGIDPNAVEEEKRDAATGRKQFKGPQA